jgi:hypothetical protein
MFGKIDLGNKLWLRCPLGTRTCYPRDLAIITFAYNFFYVSIPFIAGRTSSDPFSGLGTAVLTEIRGFCFSHKLIGQ